MSEVSFYRLKGGTHVIVMRLKVLAGGSTITPLSWPWWVWVDPTPSSPAGKAGGLVPVGSPT
jgi:hypothetical protein